MTYNAANRRVSKESSSLAIQFQQWSSLTDNIVEEQDGAGVVQVSNTQVPEVYGELVAQHDSENRFHHYDDRGSTIAITNDARIVEDELEYNAYGEEVAHTGASESPYRFQGAYGYYTDTDLGSIYIRRRIYEPETGRWLSEDPLGFVDGVNLYGAYFVPAGSDPSGLDVQIGVDKQGRAIYWSGKYCYVFSREGKFKYVACPKIGGAEAR